MRKTNLRTIFTALCVAFFSLSALAQQKSVGIFDGQLDVGANTKPGSGTYLPQSQQYVISGAGYNIWFDHDEF
ncbi:MAG TPA: hypothetical protein VK609_20840, partial [Mucilaginibacter sp.]|nr:hypothetical protein [Mucilaginibacter sp.]